MNNEERCSKVDILNMIIDQAKFIRNNLVHNSPNIIISLELEISTLKGMVEKLHYD